MEVIDRVTAIQAELDRRVLPDPQAGPVRVRDEGKGPVILADDWCEASAEPGPLLAWLLTLPARTHADDFWLALMARVG
jgi:hypothetical protein